MVLRTPKTVFILGLMLGALLLLSSCTHRIGYGLVLWSNDEGKLAVGDIVPVYVRSNITRSYIIGTPDDRTKLEIPVWKLEIFSYKWQARRRLQELQSVLHLYLITTVDGLPIRKAPSNDAARVYRLRQNEMVKVLAKVQGTKVTTGSAALEGDWYSVITNDGSRGYVFSNRMRLFDESTAGAQSTQNNADADKANSLSIEDFFAHPSWRPAYFQNMLSDNRIDLEQFNQRYGIFIDTLHHQIRIELPQVSQLFTYNTISKVDKQFSFDGTALRIRFEDSEHIIVNWAGANKGNTDTTAQNNAGTSDTDQAQPNNAGSDQSNAGTDQNNASTSDDDLNIGRNKEYRFIVFNGDIRDIVHQEELRQQRLLTTLMQAGNSWTHEANINPPARIELSPLGRFTMINTVSIPKSYLKGFDTVDPSIASVQGDLATRLYLTDQLSKDWQGTVSLRLVSVSRRSSDGGLLDSPLPRSSWLNFAYRIQNNMIEIAPAARVVNMEIEALSSEPSLKFFLK